MVTSLMNKKGFLLVDALINCLIVASLSVLCIGVFMQFDNYYKAYKKYNEQLNEKLEILFKDCNTCLLKQDS